MSGPETKGTLQWIYSKSWSRNNYELVFKFPKGTSISFGFKKKIYSSQAANKKLNAANNNGNNGNKGEQTDTIIANHNVIKAEQNQLVITDDDNGNNSSTAGDYDFFLSL